MCQALDEIMEDGIQIGISRGISQGTLAKAKTIAHNMYLRRMTAEDVAAICEEDAGVVKKWFAGWDKGEPCG